MRCMLFPQWDVMGRSPNLRYGKAHVTGATPPRVVRRDTLAPASKRVRRHGSRVMRHASCVPTTLPTISTRYETP
ncbi:hypothetical protein EMIT0158MI4_140091 [Burkholderia ambifaria]